MRIPFLPLLALASCAHLSPPAVDDCEIPLEGLTPLLGPGRMVLLGEFHGTREIPAFAGAIACEASKHGPVVVALELPPSAAVTAWLSGPDSPDARAQVLADPQWTRAYQDGRTSVAMFELIARIGALRRAGRPADLVLFDQDPDQPGRDPRMAGALLAARSAHPEATLVVLVGDLHARRRPLGNLENEPRWMANFLVDASVPFVSLAGQTATGSSWFCSGPGPETCGPEFVGSRKEPVQPGRLELQPSPDGAFDGFYQPALTTTASPPAAFPARQAGLAQELAALRRGPRALRAGAMKAYEAGQFQACADAFGGLLAPTGEDAYSHACCLARAGQKDRALERVRFALKHGVSLADLQSDEDLAALRADPRWPTP